MVELYLLELEIDRVPKSKFYNSQISLELKIVINLVGNSLMYELIWIHF